MLNNMAESLDCPIKPKAVKMDWYQTERCVTLLFLEKFISDKNITLYFDKSTVDVSMNLKDGSRYSSKLILEKEIVPDKCSYKLSSSKLEVRLVKADNVHWLKLEAAEQSSCQKVRDWDQVVKDISEEEKGELSVNELFQKIYSDGSDDVKKAMNKSFLESKGTVLSTNWETIKKKEVQPHH